MEFSESKVTWPAALLEDSPSSSKKNDLLNKSTSYSKDYFHDNSIFTCSLQRLAAAIKEIKEVDSPRRISIVATGFGGNLQASSTQLPEKLCTWLVDKFDVDSCSLNVHGVKLGLRPTNVTNMLGICDGGEAISLRMQSTKIDQIRSLYNLPNWAIYLDKLLTDVVSSSKPIEEFTVKFILYIFGSFLLPTDKMIVHEEIA
ncbi:hypothetical protein L6164_023430 [Bauhinia variegata]|uniref:Uncharacterized protein n=1 Tax=Bauhinia variegata TaxID=167791 RepID=A0ACB9MN88_BAUVA|nr:hypothetical protein L6164_023430 [Bauhinia variegata]